MARNHNKPSSGKEIPHWKKALTVGVASLAAFNLAGCMSEDGQEAPKPAPTASAPENQAIRAAEKAKFYNEVQKQATQIANKAAFGVLDDLSSPTSGVPNDGVAELVKDDSGEARWAYIGNKGQIAGPDGEFGTGDEPTTPEMRVVIDFKTGLLEVLSAGSTGAGDQQAFTGVTAVYELPEVCAADSGALAIGGSNQNCTPIKPYAMTIDDARRHIGDSDTKLVGLGLHKQWGFNDNSKQSFGDRASILFDVDGEDVFVNSLLGVFMPLPSHGMDRRSKEPAEGSDSDLVRDEVVKLGHMQESVTKALHDMTP